MFLKIIIFLLCYELYLNSALAKNIQNNCFFVKQTILQDATILTSDHQLILALQNQCLSKQNIATLLEKINNFYRQKGYIFAKASFVSFDVQKNILQLQIQEGLISSIVLDSSINQKHHIFFAGFIEKIFNIFELNSALQQFNKLHNLDAKMKISHQQNKLQIHIYQHSKQQVKLSLGYDNFGNNFTGLNRYKFGLNLYQHFNLDYIYSTKNFHSVVANTGLMWQKNYFYYNYLLSFFNQKQQNVKFSGQSYRHGFGINSLLFNDTKQQINLDNSLTLRGSVNYLENIRLTTSLQKLTIGQTSISHHWQPSNNLSTKIKPIFMFGLSSFDANKDNENQNLPQNQFRLLKLDAEISHRLPFLSLSMLHKLESQKSLSKLFGAEQITVGGYNSVSSFRENIINGDSGYIFQQKIIADIDKLLPEFTKSNVEAEIFHHYGYVNHHKQAEIKSGRLSDVGLKISVVEKKFSTSFTSSWAMHQSNMFIYNKPENYNLYFEITFTPF